MQTCDQPWLERFAFGASLCCASSIVEFARRLPSAGSLYTYNSRGLGRTGRHLLLSATAVVLLAFPLWGILHPACSPAGRLLPFTALAWLGAGAIAAGLLRARRPASFETLGRVFRPAERT